MYSSPQVEPDIALNFAPVTVSSSSFKGFVSQYSNADNIEALREKYSGCVIHRRGSELICVPFEESAEVIGESRVLDVSDYLDVVEHLVREALLRRYSNEGFHFSKLKPIRFFNASENIVGSISDKIAEIVILRPEYEIDVRTIHTKNHRAAIGLVVDVSIRADIVKSVKELAGVMSTIGMYVVSRSSKTLGRGQVIWTELQGRISRVSGDYVELADYRKAERLPAKDCYPEASKRNRKSIVDTLSSGQTNKIAFDLEKACSNVVGGEGKLAVIISLLEALCLAGPIPCSCDLNVEFSQSLATADDFDSRRVKVPTFVFDPAKNKTGHWHDDGLNEHGPFDSESFPRKEPRVVVVVPDKFKGETELFVNSFRNGVPNHARFEKGFVRKYHLNKLGKLDFEIVNSESSSLVESYRDACISCLERETYDLAIVIIEERFHDLFGNENPYLATKSIFMSQGIPVQELEIESIRGPGQAYTMNNLGLACYAKLGGTPWTISTLHPVAHELVIGLGSAVVSEGRLSEANRYLGITTVFDADGSYLLNNISREVEIEDYQSEIIRSLQQTVEEISKRNAWQKNDTVRLIFHQTFKEFRYVEIEAIKDFVSSIADLNVEFAFVHVGQDHPFMLFDRNQKGTPDARLYGAIKGRMVPERGHLVVLGDRQALLTVTGARQLRTPFQGLPIPLLISINKDSTFRDISYLSRQIFEFTFLSWRAFNPTNTPVTILYSDLIARLLGQLRHVRNWNADILRTKLRYSRWFL